MTHSPTLTIALPPLSIRIQRSAHEEEMEEKENVNQNPKITEISFQNSVCLIPSLPWLAPTPNVKVETSASSAMSDRP